MKKEHTTIILFLIASLVAASLWFRPVFWIMADGSMSSWEAMKAIFVEWNTPEYMLGAGIDQLGTFWIFAQVKEILSGGPTILPDIFYPEGWDIAKHTGYAWLDGVLSMPLQLWLGVPAFYNCHVLLTIASSFFGICWLIRGTKLPVSLCVLFAGLGIFHPFAYQEIGMGRPTQMLWLFSCLFLYFLGQSSTSQHPRKMMIAAGLCLSATCLVYWFGGVAVAFCGGIAYALQSVLAKKKWQHIQLGLLAAGIGIGLTLFLTWRISSSILQGEGGLLFDALQKEPVYVLELPFIDIPIQQFTYVHHQNHLWSLLEGSGIPPFLLTLGFLSIFIPWGWLQRLPWTLATIISIGIPITPALRWNDGWILTGQALLQTVFPPLLRCEYPERMMVAPTLLLLLITAMSLSSVFQKIKNRWFRIILQMAILLTCLSKSEQHLPTESDLRVSSFVQDDFLLEVTAQYPGGIIDVPLSRSENTYVQQIFHHQPLLGGPGLNRVQSASHKEYCASNSLLKGMEDYALTGITPPPWQEEDRQKLLQEGFSLIVFHPKNSHMSTEDIERYLGVKGIIHQRTKITAFPLNSVRATENIPSDTTVPPL